MLPPPVAAAAPVWFIHGRKKGERKAGEGESMVSVPYNLSHPRRPKHWTGASAGRVCETQAAKVATATHS